MLTNRSEPSHGFFNNCGPEGDESVEGPNDHVKAKVSSANLSPMPRDKAHGAQDAFRLS